MCHKQCEGDETGFVQWKRAYRRNVQLDLSASASERKVATQSATVAKRGQFLASSIWSKQKIIHLKPVVNRVVDTVQLWKFKESNFHIYLSVRGKRLKGGGRGEAKNTRLSERVLIFSINCITKSLILLTIGSLFLWERSTILLVVDCINKANGGLPICLIITATTQAGYLLHLTTTEVSFAPFMQGGYYTIAFVNLFCIGFSHVKVP